MILNKNIKIAFACGWSKIQLVSNSKGEYNWCGIIPDAHLFDSQGAEEQLLIIPNYFEDLNAMRVAEDTLNDDQWKRYKELLHKTTDGNGERASAQQRAEAFGVVHKLWSEGLKAIKDYDAKICDQINSTYKFSNNLATRLYIVGCKLERRYEYCQAALTKICNADDYTNAHDIAKTALKTLKESQINE